MGGSLPPTPVTTAALECALEPHHFERCHDPLRRPGPGGRHARRPDPRPPLQPLHVAATTAPTLVVVGADDGYTPPEDARGIQRLIPHAALTVVDRAGHLPNLEQPEAFNASLVDFLNSLPD
ncbi:alpha/beta fold hydrolase [Streptomyces sp. NPDC058247]|uniref:alpha/beta fold hydrolase n=1 Tax=Streptomyces sp. NPDC058247 TaxID=3346401 RepID=UPI0036E8A208